MERTKVEIENILIEFLKDMLESGNQESALKSLYYDKEKQECIIKMDVTFVDSDNYVGFAGY